MSTTTAPTGTTEFDFDCERFSSTDVIERIDYLNSTPTLDREPEDQDELDDLTAFAEQAEGYIPDWKYGETFIADYHFQDYAQELAEDIGAVNTEVGWPNGFIDWERAAEALLIDYTSFELRGTTYWAR